MPNKVEGAELLYNTKAKVRLLSKISYEGNCWKYQGAKDSLGYGYFWYKGRHRGAHRISYELFVKPIDIGLVIDHLCRNPWCVNPQHLEEVTIGENVMRGETICAKNKLKTHCPKGHLFSVENTYLAPRKGRKSDRQCRKCKQDFWKTYVRPLK